LQGSDETDPGIALSSDSSPLSANKEGRAIPQLDPDMYLNLEASVFPDDQLDEREGMSDVYK
jgi:hypothetical protein